MKEDRPSAVRPDRTPAPVGQGSAARETDQERAAIVVVGRDADIRKALSEELCGRYGADYRIVVCDEPAVLEPVIRELLTDGTPVALVIGGVGEADPDGIEVLARVRSIDRTVSRVAAVRWGEWDTARSPSLTDSMSDYLIREIAAAPNVEVSYGVQVAGGTGTDHLTSLVLEDTKTRTRRSVPADGLFVLIGSQPRSGWLGEDLARDRWGFILTGPDLLDDPGAHWPAGRQPMLLETSLPGVFAAGDVRHGSVKRVASAVGDGAITIPLVHRYLESLAVPEAAVR